MGRRAKFTPERRQAFLDAFRNGVTVETAAAVAGVHRATVYRWQAEGEQASSSPKHAFSKAMLRAWGERQVALVQTIRRAAEAEEGGDWRAAAFILERCPGGAEAGRH